MIVLSSRGGNSPARTRSRNVSRPLRNISNQFAPTSSSRVQPDSRSVNGFTYVMRASRSIAITTSSTASKTSRSRCSAPSSRRTRAYKPAIRCSSWISAESVSQAAWIRSGEVSAACSMAAIGAPSTSTVVVARASDGSLGSRRAPVASTHDGGSPSIRYSTRIVASPVAAISSVLTGSAAAAERSRTTFPSVRAGATAEWCHTRRAPSHAASRSSGPSRPVVSPHAPSTRSVRAARSKRGSTRPTSRSPARIGST